MNAIPHSELIRLVRQVAHKYFVDGMDEEDLVQEGLAAAWGALPDWKPGGQPLENWVRFCAERAIITQVKAANREKRKPTIRPMSLDQPLTGEPSADSLAEVVPAQGIDVEGRIERDQALYSVFKKVASSASYLEYRVFQMVASGHSYGEVSAALGVEPKTVDNAWQRIRGKLRERNGALARHREGPPIAAPETGGSLRIFPAGRRCAEDACPTLLTRWNPGPYCFLHEDAEDVELDMRVTEEGVFGGWEDDSIEVIEEAFV